MPSSMASGGQKAVAPHQRRLDRKTASKDRAIELVEERLRIGGTLLLFCLHQCLFGCLWRFRLPRRSPRCRLGFGIERRGWRWHGSSGSMRSPRWLVIVVVIAVACLLLLQV